MGYFIILPSEPAPGPAVTDPIDLPYRQVVSGHGDPTNKYQVRVDSQQYTDVDTGIIWEYWGGEWH